MDKDPVVMQDPYIDPKSGLLRNELGITDKAELEYVEANLNAFRDYEISEEPLPACFDLDHLRHVHRTLFGARVFVGGRVANCRSVYRQYAVCKRKYA